MEDSESLLRALGIVTEGLSVPDEVWTRVVENATDPNAPMADAGLVPEMTDEPVVPDDDEVILDDTDLPEDAEEHGDGATELDVDPAPVDDDASAFEDSDETDETAHNVGDDTVGLDTPGFDDTIF